MNRQWKNLALFFGLKFALMFGIRYALSKNLAEKTRPIIEEE